MVISQNMVIFGNMVIYEETMKGLLCKSHVSLPRTFAGIFEKKGDNMNNKIELERKLLEHLYTIKTCHQGGTLANNIADKTDMEHIAKSITEFFVKLKKGVNNDI